MNTVKVKILEDTFNKSFNLEQFTRFIKEFFNEPEMFPKRRSEGIWKEYMGHISAYYKIANYSDIDDNKLIVLAVEIKKDKSVERARTMQRNFISKVLDENGYEAAIVAFYNPSELNWRLSFVRLDYSFSDKGLKLDLTPAKRYSYLVGELEPNHTAKAQLLPIFENDKENPTIEEIEKSFTVEKVTKEFFEQYKEKYIQLKEYLEQDSSFIGETEKLGFEVPKFAEQFAKKLLGQLAFLYFLQKKGWLGVRIFPKDRSLLESDYQKIYSQQDEAHRKILDKVFEKVDYTKRKIIPKQLVELNDHEAELFSDCFVGTEHEEEWGAGDKRFISKLFQTCKKNNTRNNFFNDFLQPLFYEALNRKRKNHYFNQFNCKVPFLNGGLFEPLEGYHWRDVHFNIPNSLFSNESGKGRNADGILDIFARYNFTMNEDEPLEKEVAVDPEMLGKIFENLLDVKDRKSKGAFYTPREIVHYMCQESLANYLSKEVGVPYEDMKEFILYGDLIRDTDSRSGVGYNKKELSIKPTIYNNLVKIDKALENVKVADPAVGSGAFPLGMLSEIVKARNNITDYLVVLDNKGFIGRKFGEGVIRKKRSPFNLKWKTIKNSIFAVDIEPSAVDIAKLRLWLSVVVDQEINEVTPEPHPLPNLDMNIMVGNSLIEEYEGIKLFDENVLQKKYHFVKESGSEYTPTTEQLSLLVDYSDDMLKEMFKLQDQYFGEKNEQNKKELKKRIDELRDELIEYKLERDGNKNGLKKFKELKKKKQKPYFLWYLEFAKVFKEKSGFDIVIGNPPYIGEKGNADIFQVLKNTKKWKNFTTKRMNIYYCFIKQGLDILKKRGVLSQIIPYEWLTADHANNVRKELLNGNSIEKIIHFSDNFIFEGVGTSSMILEVNKAISNLEQNFDLIIYSGNQTNARNVFSQAFEKKEIAQNSLDKSGKSIWIFNSTESKLKNKIKPLGEILNVQVGIQSGANKVTAKHVDEQLATPEQLGRGIFELEEGIDILKGSNGIYLNISSNKNPNFIKLPEEEINFIKPVYSGASLEEWKVREERCSWFIYIYNKVLEEESIIYQYLKRYKKILVNRSLKKGQDYIEPDEFDRFNLDDIKKIYSPAGSVQKVMRSKQWYSIFFARENIDFTAEKIMTSSRAETFCYSDKESYGLSGINYIFFDKKINLQYQTKINKFSNKKDYLIYINALLNSEMIMNNIKSIKLNALTGSKLKQILDIYIIDFNDVNDFEIYKKIVSLSKQLILISNQDVFENEEYKKIKKDIDILVNYLYKELVTIK